MNFDPKELLWEQRYRPQSIKECVLPERVRSIFQKMIDDNDIPNMLLASSSPGTGKTTVARALLADLGYDVLFVNASSSRGIGLVQQELPAFCSTVSFSGKPKAVILDEADNLTPDAQKALRGLIEQFSKNVRFVLTCNYPQKIITPIRSRLQLFEFVYDKSDRLSCVKQMIIRSMAICKQEGVPVSNANVLKELVKRNYPDNRKTIVSLQNYARSGGIDEGILSQITANDDISEVINALRSRDFKTVRGLVPKYTGDIAAFLHNLHEAAYTQLDPNSVYTAIQIIGDANNNVTSCVDLEILLTYTLAQLMFECTFAS
ncbi:clamp loader subunit DNA polymerase accessory protein [Vibrio phage nt-1]|uniref:Sliding-clamp-loader large subunit n=1 Tax=Vibrio phage nt-1 TaxID=115992 RepID=R9TJ59_9CAUD|nr:clamp loader of DNA polymerase [Vibrio phage nt-1]AGN30127.1 clamp loader subunit DNA polymerase accessory protein [Vibrio phage nt-1]